MEKLKKLYTQYKEIINYLFFGGCTTIVNFVAYFIVSRFIISNFVYLGEIGIDKTVSNVIAWVIAVIFAYITNKLFVFEGKTNSKKEVIKELSSFVMARIVTLIICEIGIFTLMINVLYINEIITKLVTQIMVVVLNYLFSKLFIFKKGGKKQYENTNNRK